MSAIDMSGLRTSAFETSNALEKMSGERSAVRQVKVDHRAATRQAIIATLRREGVTVKTRSEWKAREVDASRSDGPDWDYHSIVLHHAGNSYSCQHDETASLRRAEATDIEKFGHLSYHFAVGCSGTIYEALDIRYKGAHVSGGNTGKIGIVLLADLSLPGEAYTQEYAEKGPLGKLTGSPDWVSDSADSSFDTTTSVQDSALAALVASLKKYFPIKVLGGHREFQRLATNEGRACPGANGMIAVGSLRTRYGLRAP